MTLNDSPRVLGGRYEVGELIGRGGMAEVHLGHDTRLGRQVAIKMLRADLARDQTFLTRFRREAQSAAGLNHHAIVAVYDSGEDAFTETGGATVSVPYIVMEYVDGKTLREILNEEGRLAPDEAARITMGILSALEYSHDKGIVHRDIKPANVMVTRGGSVKVMDFGIARALADVGATMTSASAVVGTARYLSPEQAQGETVDERSDLYSTGCVLFELLAGRTPFVGEPVSLVYQHIQDQPAPPSTYEPSVPESLDAVTLHSLAKARAERYQSAADFRADLQAARTGAPISDAAAQTAALYAADPGDAARRRAETEPPPGPTRPDNTADISHHEERPRRTAWWVVAGIVALAAIFGIGVALANTNDDDNPLTAVPSVQGKSQTEATQLLREASFMVQPVSVQSEEPSGQVVGQSPEGGQPAPSGATVSIQVSSGPGDSVLPDVRGQTEAQARRTLTGAGFKDSQIIIGDRQSDTKYAKDQVASIAPAPNTRLARDKQITLRLSDGLVHIPEDLSGMSSGEAYAALTNLGLKPTEQASDTSDSSQDGKVLGSDPDPGTEVEVGSDVTVYVGRVRVVVTETTTPTQRPTPPTVTATGERSTSTDEPPTASSSPPPRTPPPSESPTTSSEPTTPPPAND